MFSHRRKLRRRRRRYEETLQWGKRNEKREGERGGLPGEGTNKKTIFSCGVVAERGDKIIEKSEDQRSDSPQVVLGKQAPFETKSRARPKMRSAASAEQKRIWLVSTKVKMKSGPLFCYFSCCYVSVVFRGGCFFFFFSQYFSPFSFFRELRGHLLAHLRDDLNKASHDCVPWCMTKNKRSILGRYVPLFRLSLRGNNETIDNVPSLTKTHNVQRDNVPVGTTHTCFQTHNTYFQTPISVFFSSLSLLHV